MKRKGIPAILTIIMLILLHSACSKNDSLRVERWEGLKGGTLRVYVRIDLLKIEDEKNLEKKTMDMLLAEGRKRAILLLVSHIRIHYPDLKNVRSVERDILKIVNSGKIFHKNFDDDYSEALIDYKVWTLLNGLEQSEKKVPLKSEE